MLLSVFFPFVSCVAPGESPQNVTVDQIMAESVLVSWTFPRIHHHGVLRWYFVNFKDEDSNTTRFLVSTATSILITDLHPDRRYLISVAGYTVKTGPYSNSILLHTLEDGIIEYFITIITCVIVNC